MAVTEPTPEPVGDAGARCAGEQAADGAQMGTSAVALAAPEAAASSFLAPGRSGASQGILAPPTWGAVTIGATEEVGALRPGSPDSLDVGRK